MSEVMNVGVMNVGQSRKIFWIAKTQTFKLYLHPVYKAVLSETT